MQFAHVAWDFPSVYMIIWLLGAREFPPIQFPMVLFASFSIAEQTMLHWNVAWVVYFSRLPFKHLGKRYVISLSEMW